MLSPDVDLTPSAPTSLSPERKDVLWLVDAVYLGYSLRAHSNTESC
jgi:hypothetical protein